MKDSVPSDLIYTSFTLSIVLWYEDFEISLKFETMLTRVVLVLVPINNDQRGVIDAMQV